MSLVCEFCGKGYKSSSGLSMHKKHCKAKGKSEDELLLEKLKADLPHVKDAETKYRLELRIKGLQK